MRLDPVAIATQIEALRRAFPATEDDPNDWVLALESETNAMEFVDRALLLIAEAKAYAEALVPVIDDLRARRERFAFRDQVLRSTLLNVLDMTGVKKLERPMATLSVRNGQPSVEITNVEEVPLQFMKIKSEPNKAAIKEAILDGRFVPGATLSNGQPGLTIRRL